MGFTKNGRKFFGGLLDKATIKSLDLTTQTGEKNTNVFANTAKINDVFSSSGTTTICDINTLMTTYSGGSNYKLGICLGSNNVKEDIDDYTMESVGLTGLSMTIRSGLENGTYIFTLTATNRTHESVSVKEIGIGIWAQYVTGTAAYVGNANALLFRKVLDSPVTILPDETYTFTLILK